MASLQIIPLAQYGAPLDAGSLKKTQETTHETHISAFQPCPQSAPRIPQPHGNEERSPDPEPSPRKRPQEPVCLIQTEQCLAR